MAHVTIRPARPKDREALGALQLRASLAWGDHVEALTAMPEAGELAAEHLPFTDVAELDGRLAGFVTLLTSEPEEAELDGLFVEPELWGKGIGSALLARAERQAAAAGRSSIHVVANRRAQGFYAACGFVVVGETMTRLESAPTLRKRLA